MSAVKLAASPPGVRRGRRAGLLLLAALIAGPLAQAQTLRPAGSEITFISKQMGVPVSGSFRHVAADLSFDPKRPETASITMTIDTASATLGVPQTDAELTKPEWFASRAYPHATFRSQRVRVVGPGRYEVAGTLTIKDTSRDLVIPVSMTQAAETTTASGQFVLKRLDWRLGDGDWKDTSMVADEVQVRFRLQFTGIAPL